MSRDPAVAIIARPLKFRLKGAANEAHMIVGSGIDQMTQFLLG